MRYTNAHWLVVRDPGGGRRWPVRARRGRAAAVLGPRDIDARGRRRTRSTSAPAVVGEYTLADGRIAVPVFQLLAERYLDPQYSPDAVAERCGIPADTIRRIARELAAGRVRQQAVSLPIAWTDAWGRKHDEMVGRPVAMHAMRGISAHSNGFHTCRALHVLQLLLGAVDAPGSFRYQPPFPQADPAGQPPGQDAPAPTARSTRAPLGFVHGPEDLLVDADGQPRRIDHAFSWALPAGRARHDAHRDPQCLGAAIRTRSTRC